MAEEWWSSIIASCEGRYLRLSLIVFNIPIFSCSLAEIQEVSPIGEPSRVAFSRAVTQAFGKAQSSVPMETWSEQMISDLWWFRWRPSSAPSLTIRSRSCSTSSNLPPRVPCPGRTGITIRSSCPPRIVWMAMNMQNGQREQ